MMDINTGKRLEVNAHIKQSIFDILLTPKGETVLNRDYGSNVYKYMDHPLNIVGAEIGAEIIDAITKFEQRVKLKQIKPIVVNSEGRLEIQIILQNGNIINISKGV